MSSKGNTRDVTTEEGEILTLPRVSYIKSQLKQDYLMQEWPAKCASDYIKDKLTEHTDGGGMILVSDGMANEITDNAKGAWVRKLKEATEIGTLTHKAISSFLKGESVYVPQEIEIPFKSFLLWHEEYNVVPIAVDYVVHSLDGGGYAGEVDAVVVMADKKGGKVSSKLKVVDFKAQPYIYHEHGLQLVAYVNAYKHTVGMEELGCGICRLDKKEIDYQWKQYRDATLESLLKEFLKLTELAHIKGVK